MVENVEAQENSQYALPDDTASQDGAAVVDPYNVCNVEDDGVIEGASMPSVQTQEAGALAQSLYYDARQDGGAFDAVMAARST